MCALLACIAGLRVLLEEPGSPASKDQLQVPMRAI
jgi:hypothetical protein